MILDYAAMDVVIAREPGKRRIERIPIDQAEVESPVVGMRTWTPPDLISVPEEEWREAVRKFKILKPLL